VLPNHAETASQAATNENRLSPVKRLVKLLGLGVVFAVVARRWQNAQKVYAQEVSTGQRPIEAVGTSIAAFIGLAPRL
jgi:hypothetical protein